MTFEKIFKVPSNHTLRRVDFKQKGTFAQNESWVHEEVDENGNLVARYESWHCTSIGTSKTNSGFKKYDAGGKLLEAHDDLPI